MYSADTENPPRVRQEWCQLVNIDLFYLVIIQHPIFRESAIITVN